MADQQRTEAVAQELRRIAERMRAARSDCPTDADAIKLLLRSYGGDVTDALRSVWRLLSHMPHIARKWEGYALNVLRHKLDGMVSPTDGDAFKTVWEIEYRETADESIDCDHEYYRLAEADMTEPQRLEFYFDQAISWAKLIERTADFIAVDWRRQCCLRLNELRGGQGMGWREALVEVGKDFPDAPKSKAAAMRMHEAVSIPAFFAKAGQKKRSK